MDPLVLRRLSIVAALFGLVVVVGTVPFSQSVTAPCRTEPTAVWYLSRVGTGQIATGWERNLLNSGSPTVLLQFERPDFVEVTYAPQLHNGAYVSAGDTIAVIASHEGSGRLSVLEAELNKAQSEHDALLTGARVEDLEVAKAAVKMAEAALKSYKLERDRTEMLHNSGLISDSTWQAVEGQYNIFEAELDLEAANLIALEAGARPEDIAVAKRQVEVFTRWVESSERLLGNHEVITAPISGRVRLGGVGEELVRIDQVDTLAVFISIPESSVPLLKEGQSFNVILRADRIPSRTSKLQRIGFVQPDTAGAYAIGLGAYAIGLLENLEGHLQPGMTGRAKLSIGKKTLFSGLRAKFNI